jgi:hypothetical protein
MKQLSKTSLDGNSLYNDTLSQFSELGKKSVLPGAAGLATLVPVLEGNEEERPSPVRRSKNDLKEVKTLRQLERLDLDFDSPRWRLACHNIGVTPQECFKR